ncbi:hypothetical protein LPW11_08710 [Geomonas sp. RF6]|uniref:hypothetical protein n=1 Tax=Geomonas sp. RF6 TaxID=2897342 RepID=UPI001E53365A|nr:hypothetical protein [Geomonas sp. RF6]UFS72259.1 hypothetical protein LPW11_08710 [Geomonas sp. RF6]
MSIEINEEISRNFHLFWDNYPAPVMLIQKDRTILGVNKAALAAGYPVGVRCIDLGEKKHHEGCAADQALQEGKAVRAVVYLAHLGIVGAVNWIPLAGSSDLFLHFIDDLTEHASERLFPAKA